MLIKYFFCQYQAFVRANLRSSNRRFSETKNSIISINFTYK